MQPPSISGPKQACRGEHICLTPNPLYKCTDPITTSKLSLTCEAECSLAHSSLLPRERARARLPCTGLPAPATPASCFPSGPTPATPCGLAFEAPYQKPQFPLTFTLFSSFQNGHYHQAYSRSGAPHRQEPGAQRGE